jgi:hypothetical protein
MFALGSAQAKTTSKELTKVSGGELVHDAIAERVRLVVQLGGNEPFDEGGPGMAMVLFDGGDFTNDTLAQRAVTSVTSTSRMPLRSEKACRPLPRRHRRT